MFFPPVSADTDTDPMRQHSAPMTVKINVGSLSLAEKLNDRNIRLHFSVKLNVRSLSLTAEVNDRIIGLRLYVKTDVGSLCLAEEVNDRNIGYASAHPSKYCRYRCFADVAKYRPDTMSDAIIG